MYRTYCATCHGENGDAKGNAARFVFPKPRDFRNSPFRWTTNAKLIPSKQDIEDVIRQGIPNTSMQKWESLGDEKISQLADLVLELREAGVKESIRAHLLQDGFGDEKEGQLSDDGMIVFEQVVNEKLTAGPMAIIDLPKLSPEDRVASITRGKELFSQLSCAKCHGERGQGSFKMDLFDDKGFPTFATDFRRDPLKTNSDEAMARSILFGLPGAAMPSSQIQDSQVLDLIMYIRSLAEKETQYLTNIQRYYRAIGFRRP